MGYPIKGSHMLSHMLTNATIYISYSLNGKSKKLSFPVQENGRNSDCICRIETVESNGGKRFTVVCKPSTSIKLETCSLVISVPYQSDDRLYSNGFQSWTESKEFTTREKIPHLSRLFAPVANQFGVRKFGDSEFFSYSGKRGDIHGWSYTWVRRGKTVYAICSLAESFAYTSFMHRVSKRIVSVERDIEGLEIVDETRLFDLLFLEGDMNTIMDCWSDALAISRPSAKPAAGWNSWYNHYTGISEKIIHENLSAFQSRKIPLDIFQVDDGYQAAIGDWLTTSDRFPGGMQNIASRIHQAGYRAGIWIAPFICQKRSTIYQEKPDWIVRDSKGHMIRIGYSKGYWDDSFYCLDLYNEDVREYLRQVFSVMKNSWKFDMFKVDFLYALTHLRHPGKTRAMVMSDAIVFIRQCVGSSLLLGCGGALAPGFGIMDYYRIGSDISLKWEDNFMKHGIRYRERVSTINSLTSTIGRSPLSGRMFLNDPDVYILRNENNALTRTQRKTLFMVNQLLGDLLFTSDNIGLYDHEMYRLYRSQFPVVQRNIGTINREGDILEVNFSINGRKYLFFANLGAKKSTVRLPGGLYSRGLDILNGGRQLHLEPYECMNLMVVPVGVQGLAGDDIHIFAGSAVESVTVNGNSIQVEMDRDTRVSGHLLVQVNNPGSLYTCNGVELKPVMVEGLYFVKILINLEG
jgi:alpha-galactosidase